MGIVSGMKGQLWFSTNLVTESIEEKKMDTHQEILNYYSPSGETSEYDTISNLNVSSFSSFLESYPSL